MIDRKQIKADMRKLAFGNPKKSMPVYLVYVVLSFAFTLPSAFIDPVKQVGAYMAFSLAEFALSIFVLYPIAVSVSGYYLELSRGGEPGFASAFALRKDYAKKLGGMLYMMLFLFLWGLIAIGGSIVFSVLTVMTNAAPAAVIAGGIVIFACMIPMLMRSYAYVQAPYIIYEFPELGARKTLKASIAMMNGHRMQYFIMQLSFILWYLIPTAALSGGIILTGYGRYAGSAAAEYGGIAVLILGTASFVLILPYLTLVLSAYYDKIKRIATDEGKIQGFCNEAEPSFRQSADQQ